MYTEVEPQAISKLLQHQLCIYRTSKLSTTKLLHNVVSSLLSPPSFYLYTPFSLLSFLYLHYKLFVADTVDNFFF